jgi:hypothetical protein
VLSKVKSVQKDQAELKIAFEDGSTATFLLEDPGSSVAVRDKNSLWTRNEPDLTRSNPGQWWSRIPLFLWLKAQPLSRFGNAVMSQ